MQDRETYCGPATVMMVLSSLTPDTDPLPQQSLRDEIPETGDSYAPSDAVARVLETDKPVSNPLTFTRKEVCKPASAVDAIVRGLRDAHAPVATEYYQGHHWIVVRGALTDIDPVPGSAYDVLGFFIHNPTVVPKQGRYHHYAGDQCGRGPDFGALQEFVTTEDFITNAGSSHGTYVSIPADLDAKLESMPRLRYDPPVVEFDPLRRAAEAIASYELDAKGPLARLLHAAMPTKSQQFNDDTIPAHYVTMTQQGGDVGYVRIAVEDGRFLGVTVTEPGQLHAIRTASEMWSLLESRAFDLDGEAVRLAEDNFTVSAPFWRPCRESVSPYYPLYRVRVWTAGLARTLYLTSHRVIGERPEFFI